jgi:hypothetical protein
MWVESLLELNNQLVVQSARTLGQQGGEWWSQIASYRTPVKVQPTGAFSINMMVSSRSVCDFSGTLQFVGNTQAQLFPGSSVQVNNPANLTTLMATTPSTSSNSSIQSGSSASASQLSSASQPPPKEQQPSASQPPSQSESLPSDSPPMPPVTQPAQWWGGAPGEGGKLFPDAKSACQTLTRGRKLKALVPKYDDIKRFVAVSCEVEGLEPQYAEQTQPAPCPSGYQFVGEINGKCVLPNSESVAVDINNVTSGIDEIFIFRAGRGVEVVKVRKDGKGHDLNPVTGKPANFNTQMPNPKTGEPIENIKISVTTEPAVTNNSNSGSPSGPNNLPKLPANSSLPDLRNLREDNSDKWIGFARNIVELINYRHSLLTSDSELERRARAASERIGTSVSGIECESLGLIDPFSCSVEMQMQTYQIWKLNITGAIGGAMTDALEQNK